MARKLLKPQNPRLLVLIAQTDISNKEISDFQDILDTVGEQEMCHELNPGQKKTVHPGTGLDMFGSYTVRKESDGAYSVALNLEFFSW